MPWAQPQVLRQGGQLPLRRCVFTSNLLLLLRTGSHTHHDTESPFSPQGATPSIEEGPFHPLRAQAIAQVGGGPEEGLAPLPLPPCDLACPAEIQLWVGATETKREAQREMEPSLPGEAHPSQPTPGWSSQRRHRSLQNRGRYLHHHPPPRLLAPGPGSEV